MAKRKYSLATLRKMLERAEKRYYEETAKPYVPRGYHQPSLRAWSEARDRVMRLRSEIAEREAECSASEP
ncbi:MAG: hypothetical protein IJQ98_11600 [Oscillospiraceae bacterium]|nr:hypothetical protein [Oscillospiraceae bacterium]MBR0313021.1 hypothetical protein [Oscillospiraceae bacterium]